MNKTAAFALVGLLAASSIRSQKQLTAQDRHSVGRMPQIETIMKNLGGNSFGIKKNKHGHGKNKRLQNKKKPFSKKKQKAPEARETLTIAGFTCNDVLNMREIRNYIAFSRLSAKEAEKYLRQNWQRVGDHVNGLVADQSKSKIDPKTHETKEEFVYKITDGVVFSGPDYRVTREELVKHAALDMLAECFMKKYAPAFPVKYALFGVNITNQESRELQYPDGFGGAGLKQLTPYSALACGVDESEITDDANLDYVRKMKDLLSDIPGFEKMLVFKNSKGETVPYVKVKTIAKTVKADGEDKEIEKEIFAWNYDYEGGETNEPRNHIIGAIHRNVHMSAMHFLMLHREDPARSAWWLLYYYNNNRRKRPNGVEVRKEYADYITKRIEKKWPSVAFTGQSGNVLAHVQPKVWKPAKTYSQNSGQKGGHKIGGMPLKRISKNKVGRF